MKKSLAHSFVIIFVIVILACGIKGQASLDSYGAVAGQKDADAASKSQELAEAVRLNSEVVRLFGAGRYEEALPLAKRVLDIRERLLGDDVLVVYALNNLASIFMERNKVDEAETLYRRALGVIEKIGAGTSDIAAEVSTHLGVLKLRGKDYKGAEPFLLRSLDIEEKLHGADDPAVVPALFNLADFSYYRRDSKAMFFSLNRAVTILGKQPPRKDPEVASRLKSYLCPVMSIPEGKELEGKLESSMFRFEEPERAAEFERAKKEREARGDSDKNNVEGGVLAGRAISKPGPVYPIEAKRQRIMGAVVLRIVIDEKGEVIEATKICGNALLANAAIEAALKARFTPTLLSGVPVKVSGIITYHFVLQ